jgi:uncharacterized protein (DUF983 family)
MKNTSDRNVISPNPFDGGAEMVWRPKPAMPALWPALRRGLAMCCPVCGKNKLFHGYLKLRGRCAHCHTRLGDIRADDLPPYFTILITGHVVVPLLLVVEKTFAPPLWIEAAIFLPLTTLLTLSLLRPIKGAVVGWLLFHQQEPDGSP